MSSQTQVKSLVSTDWIADHAKDAGLRLVEVDVDPTNYEKGHIEGAVGWNWKRDLQDQVARDIAPYNTAGLCDPSKMNMYPYV